MKILFILTYYYPHWTGLTQYAGRVAEGLVDKGHQVKVLTTKHQDHLKNSGEINGVLVKREAVWFRFSRTLISPGFLRSIWSEVKGSDRVVVYLPLAEVIWVALVCKLLNKKLFLAHNGDLVLPKGLLNKALESFYFHSTSKAIEWSEKIFVNTKDYSENSILLSQFKDKWVVAIPPFPQIKPAKVVPKVLKQLLKDKSPKVGFAGRFVSEKGFDYLLKAIPLVKKSYPNVKFIFAGETEIPYEGFYQKNKQLIDDNKESLVFLGLLDQSQMPHFFQAIDLFVISSRTDCFPAVQNEALIAGVPSVVTNIPGARWPVKFSGMGEVVKAGNEKSLAEGIIKVLKNRRRYVGHHKKVLELFEYKNNLSIYDEALSV